MSLCRGTNPADAARRTGRIYGKTDLLPKPHQELVDLRPENVLQWTMKQKRKTNIEDSGSNGGMRSVERVRASRSQFEEHEHALTSNTFSHPEKYKAHLCDVCACACRVSCGFKRNAQPDSSRPNRCWGGGAAGQGRQYWACNPRCRFGHWLHTMLAEEDLGCYSSRTMYRDLAKKGKVALPVCESSAVKKNKNQSSSCSYIRL